MYIYKVFYIFNTRAYNHIIHLDSVYAYVLMFKCTYIYMLKVVLMFVFMYMFACSCLCTYISPCIEAKLPKLNVLSQCLHLRQAL